MFIIFLNRSVGLFNTNFVTINIKSLLSYQFANHVKKLLIL
ncbi:hypothetical protein I3842_11G147300 [Carya illinoinensis]|uniref:Uncharacterized protein n=1 Tax=Carya illinoinensis TaxID=32201 RepID=A0A922J0U0_CARIL|nr:hypothetical protein I3842_11G147300 [Carya illinoinensis]